jgi:hypothetical protein
MTQLCHLRMRMHPSFSGVSGWFARALIWSGFALCCLMVLLLLLNRSAAKAAPLAGDSTLSIPSTTIDVMNSSTFLLPVTFVSNTNDIASVSFSLDYDHSCLTFDSITDSNADGVPDAVTNVPSGFSANVAYDAGDTDGEIDILISDQSQPLAALNVSTLVNFTFGVQPACRTTMERRPMLSLPSAAALAPPLAAPPAKRSLGRPLALLCHSASTPIQPI